jgi:hypothetical protein
MRFSPECCLRAFQLTPAAGHEVARSVEKKKKKLAN